MAERPYRPFGARACLTGADAIGVAIAAVTFYLGIVTQPSAAGTLPDDILQLAADWHLAGEPTAIATVIDTWGSAPRPRGSRMVLTASGRMAGSVSGGCVEAAVAAAACRTFADGLPQVLEFGISNERAWEVGLACGGELTIFLERVG